MKSQSHKGKIVHGGTSCQQRKRLRRKRSTKPFARQSLVLLTTPPGRSTFREVLLLPCPSQVKFRLFPELGSGRNAKEAIPSRWKGGAANE
jgi:hypothetical protein